MKTRVTLKAAVLALAPCVSVTAQVTKVITATAASIKPVTKR